MWEDSLIIPATKDEFETLDSVASFMSQKPTFDIKKWGDVPALAKKDTYPLPITEDREGYFDDRHYDYWLSGLKDFLDISMAATKAGIQITSDTRVLDLGCASGRTIRHFAIQSPAQAWGCDISVNHVLWCNRYLPENLKVFQNTSLPHLQIEDNFFDIIYAMSVFTHIESFETSWLCELSRILKPGGMAYVTIHDESSWKNMPTTWGAGHAVTNHPEFDKKWLKDGFPGEKFISRWHKDKSYSSNVFYKLSYIKKVWGKFFEIDEVIPNGSAYQTVLVLRPRK